VSRAAHALGASPAIACDWILGQAQNDGLSFVAGCLLHATYFCSSFWLYARIQPAAIADGITESAQRDTGERYSKSAQRDTLLVTFTQTVLRVAHEWGGMAYNRLIDTSFEESAG
jgi:hypothetical protein